MEELNEAEAQAVNGGGWPVIIAILAVDVALTAAAMHLYGSIAAAEIQVDENGFCYAN